MTDTSLPQLSHPLILLVQEGVIPVPIFINGVEAHTVVRDMLTSRAEQHALRLGQVGQRGAWCVAHEHCQCCVRMPLRVCARVRRLCMIAV